MTYRAKLFIDRDLACFINKQLSISEEDAELESYYERSFEIPFPQWKCGRDPVLF